MRPGLTALFLATDDPAIVAQARAEREAGKQVWLLNEEEQRLNGSGTRLRMPGETYAFECLVSTTTHFIHTHTHTHTHTYAYIYIFICIYI